VKREKSDVKREPRTSNPKREQSNVRREHRTSNPKQQTSNPKQQTSNPNRKLALMTAVGYISSYHHQNGKH